jgi:CcmD family protein
MGYLAAGFVAIWLLVMVYVVFMALRQGKLEQELVGLEEALQEQRRNAPID